MQWNYQKVIYFLKVAETLNFSTAAKELYISPQALNKQILQLEHELGEPLFVRSTRKVTLSPLGREMQHAFLPAREAFHNAAKTMEHYFEKRARTVRIGFFQALPKNEVIAPLSNYLRSFEPNLHITLSGGELDDMIDWLYQGKCDLVLTNAHDFESWDHMTEISLIRTPAKVVISLFHPWMVKDQITLADLASETLLLYERRKTLEIDSFYRKINAKAKEYAPNFSSQLATLELGTAYGVIPKMFENMTHTGLRYLDLPKELEFHFRMAAFYRPDNPFASLFEHLHDAIDDGIIRPNV